VKRLPICVLERRPCLFQPRKVTVVVVVVIQLKREMIVRVNEREDLRLKVGCSPLFVLLLEIALDPGDSNGGPNTGPQEGENPSDLIKVRGVQ
jgi:hypothetical protein